MATEKKKKPEEERGWIVEITHFTDDYKPRGGDWSDTTTKIFRDQKSAEAYLFSDVHDFIEEERGDSWELEDEEAFVEAHKSLDALLTFAEKFNDGEFVARKRSWELRQVEYEDRLAKYKCGCKKDLKKRKREEAEEEEEPAKKKKKAKLPEICACCKTGMVAVPRAACGAGHPKCMQCAIVGKPCPACL